LRSSDYDTDPRESSSNCSSIGNSMRRNSSVESRIARSLSKDRPSHYSLILERDVPAFNLMRMTGSSRTSPRPKEVIGGLARRRTAHSIISLKGASSVGGILAVFRLMISSNMVGRLMRHSDGLSPFRIRSTKTPSRDNPRQAPRTDKSLRPTRSPERRTLSRIDARLESPAVVRQNRNRPRRPACCFRQKPAPVPLIPA
jgi:hypothetical protein